MTDFNINDIVNKAELKALAEQSLNLCTQDAMKSPVYYYAMARYLVAVFEAHSLTLPVQVWNEYRNSLDHLMRSFLTSDPTKIESQIRASRGHLLRACLDVIKLLCAIHHDWFKGLKESKAYFTYALVDNGNFLRDLEDKYSRAQQLSISAKTQDINLGHDIVLDTQIVDLYLDAYFAYKELHTTFQAKQGASIVSSISYYLLYLKANWSTLLFSTGGKIIAAIILLVVGRYSDNFWKAIQAGYIAFIT